MKVKIISMIVFLFVFGLKANAQDNFPKKTTILKAFGEVDVPIAIFTKGIAANIGVRHKQIRLSAGYSHFDAPSKSFSGVPNEFKLRVDYIYAINFDYFYSSAKTDKGLYARLMYHNKRQYVENKTTRDSKFLYSQLAGLEIGYVFRLFHGLYIAPRIGALYYIKSPQGKENNPILIGNAYYDNKRHKTWDTYLIPTFSVGYSF